MSDLEDVEPSRVKPADCLPNLNFVSLDGFHPRYVSDRVKVVPIVDTVNVQVNFAVQHDVALNANFVSRRENGAKPVRRLICLLHRNGRRPLAGDR